MHVDEANHCFSRLSARFSIATPRSYPSCLARARLFLSHALFSQTHNPVPAELRLAVKASHALLGKTTLLPLWDVESTQINSQRSIELGVRFGF